MPITMEIPAEWLAEAGVQNFKPARSAFRCAAPHMLIALAEIEPPMRRVPLDANGFERPRMLSVLKMIHDDLPSRDAIQVLRQAGQWPYRLHHGVHRYYASLTLGLSHVPVEVIDLTF
jgi:hypothetical protein